MTDRQIALLCSVLLCAVAGTAWWLLRSAVRGIR